MDNVHTSRQYLLVNRFLIPSVGFIKECTSIRNLTLKFLVYFVFIKAHQMCFRYMSDIIEQVGDASHPEVYPKLICIGLLPYITCNISITLVQKKLKERYVDIYSDRSIVSPANMKQARQSMTSYSVNIFHNIRSSMQKSDTLFAYSRSSLS